MGWGGVGGVTVRVMETVCKRKIKNCRVWNRESMLINICVQREGGKMRLFFSCLCVCVSRVYEENSANKEEAPCDLNTVD